MSITSKIKILLGCASILTGMHLELSAVPFITSLTPYSGTTWGGTEVVIKGRDLSLASSVFFGDVPGTITAISKYEITAISPPHVPQAVHVTLVDHTGSSIPTEVDYFVYQGNWRAYTVQSDTALNNVAFVDVNDFTVSAPVTVGNAPSTLISLADGTRLFIPNYDSNTVSVVDTGTNKNIATINVESSPFGACISRDNQLLFVANYNAASVSVIDTKSYAVKATIPVESEPLLLEVTPDGKLVFVTNYNSNTVSVINTSTLAVVASLPVGQNPSAVVITPDGTTAFISNYGHTTISVIDIPTLTVQSPISVGNGPDALAITPGAIGEHSKGLLLVTNYTDSTVSFIDIATLSVVSTVAVGTDPAIVALTPDGSLATVANDEGAPTDTISIIDVASQTVLSSPSYNEDPEGLAITPDGLKLFISGDAEYLQGVSLVNPYSILGNTVPYGLDTVLILPDQAPLARFDYKIKGNKVRFDASESISPVGTITSYIWDFGDGTTETTTEPQIKHQFTKESKQTVSLRVINSAGTSISQLYNFQSASVGDECMGSSLFRNGGSSAATAHAVEIIAPRIKALFPKEGSENTEVTIVGEGFKEATNVKFGNKKARILSVSEHEIVVIAPKQKKGVRKVHVSIKTPLGTSKRNKKSVFDYNNSSSLASSSSIES